MLQGKEGTAIKYITRNQALKRLQIKLPEFRRLCILKGIHPREPNKKIHGPNRTYYHIKDIKFLMREPLLEKGREIVAHRKKIRKAKGKLEHALAERLRLNTPSYTLDHLVKERYPSFIDALRDLDDALTMINLFAVLPANPRLSIPLRHIHAARRLSLEWQAYITKTHSLRKTFVSVKGIYYQAEVIGQKITWLIPHSLAQTIPTDVDFKVMVNFLEFYETLLSFVNFKLYHDLNLKYPPIIDRRMEKLSAELYAMVKDLSKSSTESKGEGESKNDSSKNEEETGKEENNDEREVNKRKRDENLLAESNLRLSSLQERLSSLPKTSKGAKENENEADNAVLDDEGEKAKTEVESDDANDDPESRICRRLFKTFVFFLSRETPREPLLFLIRSFGGLAGWEGEGSPFEENDESITHQVVDRPSQKRRILSREYVQPQWLFDCVNNRIILPSAHYAPGLIPPPHLSPFVDNEMEGYVPEYAQVIERMKKDAMGIEENQKLLEISKEEDQSSNMAAIRNEDASMASQLAEIMNQERTFHEELSKELSGVPFSSSLQKDTPEEDNVGDNDEDELNEDEEEEVKEKADEKNEKVEKSTHQPKKGKGKKGKEKDKEGGKEQEKVQPVKEEKEEKILAELMMPRKTKRLYDAIKVSHAAKKAKITLLEERKKKAKGLKSV